mmetsp:Transcript_1077/g.6928  ORF Transcript_1077/g.6928 Transcript_1077/m.6928 type:complete len:256 (-) Transcript_1077:1431-2198(-)
MVAMLVGMQWTSSLLLARRRFRGTGDGGDHVIRRWCNESAQWSCCSGGMQTHPRPVERWRGSSQQKGKMEIHEQEREEEECLDEQEQEEWIQVHRVHVRKNQQFWVGVLATMAVGWTLAYARWTWEQHHRPWQRKWHAEMHGVVESFTVETLDAVTAVCMSICAALLLQLSRTHQRPRRMLASKAFRICTSVAALVTSAWLYACLKRGAFLVETAWMPVVPLGFFGLCCYSLQQLDVLHQHLDRMVTLRYHYKKV